MMEIKQGQSSKTRTCPCVTVQRSSAVKFGTKLAFAFLLYGKQDTGKSCTLHVLYVSTKMKKILFFIIIISYFCSIPLCAFTFLSLS